MMQNKLKYFVPQIYDAIFFTLFVILVLRVPSMLLVDCDTGLHIRIGEYIINNFSVPRYDIYSSIIPPLPYIAYEWLSQVIMAFVYYRLGGLTGIVIFFAFLIAFTFYLLFRLLKRENGNIIIAVCAALVVLCASSIHWQARPHIFSVLLFTIFYYILDAYQYKNKNYLFALPFVMLLWVNLHGAFVLGFALCGIYLAGNIARIFTADEAGKALCQARAKTLFFIFVLLAAASLLNPNGLNGVLQPFNVVSNKMLVTKIAEYSSPDFRTKEVIPFAVLLIFMAASFVFSGRKKDIIEITLAALFTFMAFYSLRNIPFFAIVISLMLVRDSAVIPAEKLSRRDIAVVILIVLLTGAALLGAEFPVLAFIMAPALIFGGKTRPFGEKRGPGTAWLIVAALITLAVFFALNIMYLGVIIIPMMIWKIKESLTASSGAGKTDTGAIGRAARDFFWLLLPVAFISLIAKGGHIYHRFNGEIKPVAATEFLKKEPVPGNMFNEYAFGTYIIFSAYPQYKVFIDGRAEMYGPQRLEVYDRITSVKPGWEEALILRNINFVFMNGNSILSQFLLRSDKWRLIYSDKVADIFVRNIPENRRLIEKYRGVRPYGSGPL